MNQEDLEYLITKGFIDEAQALVLFQQILSTSSEEHAYTLQNDLYIGGFLPLVYSLHMMLLAFAVSLSLVQKHLTLKYSTLLFLAVKLAEILMFYLYALYMQSAGCIAFSVVVHYVFDLTVYQLLLDVLSLL